MRSPIDYELDSICFRVSIYNLCAYKVSSMPLFTRQIFKIGGNLSKQSNFILRLQKITSFGQITALCIRHTIAG